MKSFTFLCRERDKVVTPGEELMIENRVVLECGEEFGAASDKSMAGSQWGTDGCGKGQSERNTVTL